MKRWKCPQDIHPGVLAPSKPRKNDIRRYCIPCSQKSGRLTERIAPAVAKARAVAAERAVKKAVVKKARAKAHTAAYYTVAGINALDYARKLATLPAFSKVKARTVQVEMHRTSKGSRIHGRAHSRATIELFVAPFWTETMLRHTILHELAHHQAPPKFAKRVWSVHHSGFQRVLARATKQADERIGAAGGYKPYLVGDGKAAHARR